MKVATACGEKGEKESERAGGIEQSDANAFQSLPLCQVYWIDCARGDRDRALLFPKGCLKMHWCKGHVSRAFQASLSGTVYWIMSR